MATDPVQHRSDSAQDILRNQGILPCEISEYPAEPPVLDDSTDRMIRTTSGQRLIVSVPRGLRAPCFRLSLPEQGRIARLVIDDLEELAKRVGAGHPAKGIGTSANQSASLVPKILAEAKGTAAGQHALHEAQRTASIEAGAIPAFFRYRDPLDNVVRMFNPVDSTARNPDGSYAVKTDLRLEGCLSSIQLRGQVTRPIVMTVDGDDLEGQGFRITARGPAARLLGHELSHVNRGIAGLCIIEEGLPVIPVDEYRKMPPQATDWSYSIDFAATPYLELSDPAGRINPADVRARLIDQGMFTPAGVPAGDG